MNFFDDMSRFENAIALITEDGKKLTYKDTAAVADAFGSHVARGELAVLLTENCAESVYGYIGCLRARCPVILLARETHSTLLASLLSIYRPNRIWLPQDLACQIDAKSELFTHGNYVLLRYSDESIKVYDQLALLMTTSGSTGSPKLVRQSYRNIATNADSIAEYLDISYQDRAITSLPMNYVYGLSVINSHLASGAAVILTDMSLMQKRFWELAKAQGATSLSGVPYTIELLKHIRWNRTMPPSLKLLTQAGGKLRPDLVREIAARCDERGMRFFVMYGAAEATARMAYLPPQLVARKPASIGIAIPGGKLWLQDEDGHPINEVNQVGELVYSGPNVSLGYAQRREDLALGDEWCSVLKTGDLAKRDQDGYYCVVGRRNRFVKLYGNRVNLDDVEQILLRANIRAACLGDDECITIYVTAETNREQAICLVQQITGLPRTAFRATVIDAIPRNRAGKITYMELR